MSERVLSYFPDVPEACQNCPALEAAADSLDFFFGVTGELAAREDNPESPVVGGEDFLKSLATPQQLDRAAIANIFADNTAETYQTVMGLARTLYSACTDGALQQYEPAGKITIIPPHRVYALIRQCRSHSPLGLLIPTLYSES